MNDRLFTERDFENLLDRFGTDLAGWPADDRLAATTLLRRSATARALLAEARQLQTAFDALPTPTLPAGLRARIVANAQRRPSWLDWLTTNTWRPASLACIPLLLGFAIGTGFADDTADLEDSVLVAFSDPTFADFQVLEANE